MTDKIKKIDINPLLFNSANSTKRNTSDKKKPKITHAITPNAIKTKLLERIKAHKKKELQPQPQLHLQEKTDAYTNEFNDSMAYLSSISKHKKELDKKAIFEKNTHDVIISANKTIKNYHPLPHVELELPEELQEVPPIIAISYTDPPIKLQPNYTIDNTDVPYGCLKGGIKPTYKSWNKTQKNYMPVEPIYVPTVDPVSVPNRESRMNELKEKLRKKKDTEKIVDTKPLIKIPVSISNQMHVQTPMLIPEPVQVSVPVQVQSNVIRKTIKQRYVLGKSRTHSRVGVLIKDNNTRKRILQAHRDMKKLPINDVKKYLRDHGLLKVGSTAPNDIVRKIYESSMLSGEITNNSKDVLLHNFLKEE